MSNSQGKDAVAGYAAMKLGRPSRNKEAECYETYKSRPYLEPKEKMVKWRAKRYPLTEKEVEHYIELTGCNSRTFHALRTIFEELKMWNTFGILIAGSWPAALTANYVYRLDAHHWITLRPKFSESDNRLTCQLVRASIEQLGLLDEKEEKNA